MISGVELYLLLRKHAALTCPSADFYDPDGGYIRNFAVGMQDLSD
jgi:hypothetical protein